MTRLVRFGSAALLFALAASTQPAPADWDYLTVPAFASAGSYQSDLELRAGTFYRATVWLTFNYRDLGTGQTGSETRAVVIPGRGARIFDSAAQSLFNVYGDVVGEVLVTGDITRVQVNASVRHGSYSAFLPTLPSDSPYLLRPGVTLTSSGFERTSSSYTNLILAEADGSGATVLVEVLDSTGRVKGSREVALAAYDYQQINDVLLDITGLSGSLWDMQIRVSGLSGTGKVAATATTIESSGALKVTTIGAQLGGPPIGF